MKNEELKPGKTISLDKGVDEIIAKSWGINATKAGMSALCMELHSKETNLFDFIDAMYPELKAWHYSLKVDRESASLVLEFLKPEEKNPYKKLG
jgi:hypothetical protein